MGPTGCVQPTCRVAVSPSENWIRSGPSGETVRVTSPPTKLAVVSHVLPPSWSGQAVMLHRLLRAWDARDYCLISIQDYTKNAPYTHTATDVLPGAFFHLPREVPRFTFNVGGRLGRAAARFSSLVMRSVDRARNIAAIAKNQRCSAILACSGDGIDIPAAFLAALFTKRPFYVYLFDDYVYQWQDRLLRFFAAFCSRAILRNTKCVIVPNEFLAKDYARRYGVEPVVIRNPSEGPGSGDAADVPWPENDGEIKIVYTGSVYQAHYDAFRNLVAAMKLLQPTNFKLHLYTAQTQETLEREGICGSVVLHGHLPNTEILAVQSRSDILFLPLAFESPCPQVINTSAPGKMGEYLVAGRPILVHAPAESFVSWYFRKHQCGTVVDRSDPTELVKAIQRICADGCYREKLSVKARERFAADFNVFVVQGQFRRLFETDADV